MNLLHAILLAIIEGLTEFLPVSSTGHMIIGSTAMGIQSEPFVKVFTVAIQFGAILSVVVLYWRRFFQNFAFYLRLAVAFLPAAVFGLLLKSHIDRLLENIVVVAVALIAGGIVFLFLDGYFERRARYNTSVEDITLPKALNIGLFQVVSMIPGVSRSAATIIGGLTQGLSPTTAAEFSFFLAVPTMFAATCKSLWDYVQDEGGSFSSDELLLLGVGNIVAFAVALIAIRSFIAFLTKHGFKVFGYYRIAVGLLILGLWAAGYFEGLNVGNF
ncbi:MAG TPA: undecaprenyl-diphosphate phosphatase [Saprospiraceae bacterium]|nr:undecaprenyl-diphosphate phosphatase [Saprospiraceae bacterium]